MKVRIFITPPMKDPWYDCIFTFTYMTTIKKSTKFMDLVNIPFP